MMRKPTRDYHIAIPLAFLVVICCVPLAGANDGNNQAWVQQTSNAEWAVREGHSSVALSDGSIVMMGGSGVSGFYNDVWRSTDNGATWMEMTSNAGWSPRCRHSSVAMPDGSIVLIGGVDIGANDLNDVWRSTDKGATWTQQTASAGWSVRSGYTSVALSDGSIVLMGGMGSIWYNDVWLSTNNGATWTQQTATAGWMARQFHTSVAMPDGSIVLMGGRDNNKDSKNDVWLSTDNGATWTQQTATAGWIARCRHRSVAMPDGSIVLMGGGDKTLGNMNDVWRSTDNGATWMEMTSNAGWSPRYDHSSVAMPDGSVVLMGGFDNNGFSGLTNDVWRLPPAATPQTGSISISSDPAGATIYLDEINQGVTPKSLEKIPFGVHVVKLTLDNYQDWSDNVELTAASPSATINPTLTLVSLTYSITCIENYTDLSRIPGSFEECDKIPEWLNETSGWSLNFYHKDNEVLAEDFGTQDFGNQGLDDSTFHYHSGHGVDWNNYGTFTRITLYNFKWLLWQNSIDRSMVYKKWDNKNKWVLISSCGILRDLQWGGALKTSHGILGFSTTTGTGPNLPDAFFKFSIEDKNTVVDAYVLATQKVFKGTGFKGVAIADTSDQWEYDHLPGQGYVAPDENPDDDKIYYSEWEC